jgi:hypothetical protein
MALVAGLAMLAGCSNRTVTSGEDGTGTGAPGTADDGGDGDGGDGGDDGDGDGGDGGDDGTTTATGGGSTGTDDGWTTGDDWPTGDDGGGFYGGPPPDVGDVPDCDVWSQDCPEGQKCIPWANDGGNVWNAHRCVWVDPDPMYPGEPCTVGGGPTSGIDDCDATSMCWYVDPTTNEGVCRAFCMGSPQAQACDEPGAYCNLLVGGVVPLCWATCDPILQDCPDGQGCYPVVDTFDCMPDRSGNAGQYGDPCEQVDECAPGLFCANVDVMPGCMAPTGCCTEFCDLDGPDPLAHCQALNPAFECVPWWEDAACPPAWCHIGGCIVPS